MLAVPEKISCIVNPHVMLFCHVIALNRKKIFTVVNPMKLNRIKDFIENNIMI